jgi:hypothetical protein
MAGRRNVCVLTLLVFREWLLYGLLNRKDWSVLLAVVVS